MEIIVDNFAGGGGASTGIEMAVGRDVDIAINHDIAAIKMHKVNHPNTKHYCEDIWEVDPKEVCKDNPVALAWFSPDCKYFSKAKGGKPVDKNIRGLAWVAVRWAKTVRPRVIMLENVEEFKTWGPLMINNKPDPKRRSETFNQFVKALKKCGYKVDYRELKACDYGAPTIRKRFFLIARCDGAAIKWPKPTHGDPQTLEVRCGLLKPWRTAAEIINWSLPCPSIFERKKPLVENTLKRIAKGIEKFIANKNPYMLSNEKSISPLTHTIDFSNQYRLITSYLIQLNHNSIGQSLDKPLNTITAGAGHFGEIRAFLLKYYGSDVGQELNVPLHTVTSKDRFGLVTVHDQDYQIVDIGMRMLTPRELFNAQGFPEDYIIDHDFEGKKYPKTEQVARCGNAVPPPFAKALVEANLPEICKEKIKKEAI